MSDGGLQSVQFNRCTDGNERAVDRYPPPTPCGALLAHPGHRAAFHQGIHDRTVHPLREAGMQLRAHAGARTEALPLRQQPVPQARTDLCVAERLGNGQQIHFQLQAHQGVARGGFLYKPRTAPSEGGPVASIWTHRLARRSGMTSRLSQSSRRTCSRVCSPHRPNCCAQ
jgi:hypothetical protein